MYEKAIPNEQYGIKYDSSYMFSKVKITCRLPKIIPDIKINGHLCLNASRKAFLNTNSSVIGASNEVMIIDIIGKFVNRFLTFCSLLANAPDKKYDIIRLDIIIRNNPVNQ